VPVGILARVTRAYLEVKSVQQRLVWFLERRLLLGVLVAGALFVAAGARADSGTEKEAQALQRKAIQEDFLNLDYPSAIKKLQAGLAKCGPDKCSPAVRGSLLRDMGAMRILGGAVEEGRGDFGSAVAADSNLDLDPAYKNAKLEAEWAAAKGAGHPSHEETAAPAASSAASSASPAAPSSGSPQGDFQHTAPTEQTVRTPLPVYVEYKGSETLKRVHVKYRAPGMAEWAAVDLKKIGDDGWGGLIPCKDVVQGKLEYFLQGFNAADDPVATSGTRAEPYAVAIKPSIDGAAPSLPGESPPAQCSELVGVECPPDFPGCKNHSPKGEEAKPEGAECEHADECESGSCTEGHCDRASTGAPYPKVWLGLGLTLDLLAVPGVDDVCALNAAGTAAFTSGSPYVCYDSALSANFPPSSALNATIDTYNSNRRDYVNGGLARGPVTASASLDYALDANVLIGARAGYELLTYPGSNPGPAFAPFRLEARFTYLLGADAIQQKFAPMFLAAVGAGEFDASVPVKVTLVNPPAGSPYQAGTVKEDAWVTAGPIYAAVGAGARLAFGGERKNVALIGDVKLMAAFGGTAGFLFGVAPELGVQYGF
jgi:hypothetical protein